MRRTDPTLRLFFATDFHGSTRTFRKFLSSPSFYGADVVIMGGDLTGKRLVSAESLDGSTEDQQQKLVERSEIEGSYVLSSTGHQSTREAEGRIATETEMEVFVTLASERLEQWLHRAEKVLSETGTPCYVIAGNDDPPEIATILDAHRGPLVRFCEDRVLEVPGGYLIAGLGFSNRTPWDTHREADEPELESRLRAVIADAGDSERLIVSVHVPPYGTLDVCPLLDTSVDPPRMLVKGGHVIEGSVGSTAVRDVLLETKPLLALCGHIHESRGAIRLGRTLVVNPGSEYSDGILRGAVVTLKGGRVKNYQLTSG